MKRLLCTFARALSFGATTAIALLAATASQQALASGNSCGYQLTENLGEPFGVDTYTLTFEGLQRKMYTRAQLEEAYAQVQHILDAAKDEVARGAPVFHTMMPRGDEDGLYGVTENRRAGWEFAYEPNAVRGDKDTITPVLRLYECHKAAGWPTATDSAPQTSQPSSVGAAPAPRGSANGKGAPITIPAQKADGVYKISDDEAHGLWRTQRNAYLANSNTILPRPGADPSEIRKRLVLPTLKSCLEVVNVKQDRDVKTIYWFAIRNRCSQQVQAYWSSDPKVDTPNMAAEIGVEGLSDMTWIDMRGLPFKVKGTACPVKYAGETVYWDVSHMQCWTWD